jgi:FkbM family methyltransferase
MKGLTGKLKREFNRLLNQSLHITGTELTSLDELKLYRSLESSSILYSILPQEKREIIAPFLPYSKAQLAQDLFALSFTEDASPKFFVEFGATDGVSLSNTWLLEKKLGWNGILAEPGKTWHNAISKNRTCFIDTRCVAGASGLKYSFLEVIDCDKGSPELSGVEKYFGKHDRVSKIRRKNSTSYEVDTISLGDLLDQYNAPKDIQFLSLDTEGSELEILKGYDFKKRTIRSICVEHNYAESNRKAINALLLEKGYTQVLKQISKWDDWYVLKQD